MFNSTDAFGNPTAPIINTLTNFGWEYVWHCHILSHEEMDMMRPISVATPPKKPTIISGTITGNGSKKQVNLTWTDASSNESSFTIQRSSAANGPWTNLATVAANTTTYADVIGNTGQAYFYRVVAVNTVGYTETPGYSNLSVTGTSNTFPVGTIQTNLPASPTNLTAAAQSGPQVLLTWTDNANNETGFIIERAIGAGPFTTLITVAASNGNVSYTDTTVTAGNTYSYRVAALNSAGMSGYSNTASVSLAGPPIAPVSVTATAQATKNGKNATVTLTWTNVANETGYTIERATNTSFTANKVAISVSANVTNYTTGNLARSTPYYFRVLSYNGSGPSAWTNATPFPITTP